MDSKVFSVYLMACVLLIFNEVYFDHVWLQTCIPVNIKSFNPMAMYGVRYLKGYLSIFPVEQTSGGWSALVSIPLWRRGTKALL